MNALTASTWHNKRLPKVTATTTGGGVLVAFKH